MTTASSSVTSSSRAASSSSPTLTEDSRPHVRVIQARLDTFEEVSFDAVTIKDYEKNLPINYRLDFIADDGIYFILSPKDVIKATPRSFDDHIHWLIEPDRYHFEQALDEIKASNLAKIYNYQVNKFPRCFKNYRKFVFFLFLNFNKVCGIEIY